MSSLEILSMVRTDPVAVAPPMCACKKCGSKVWNWAVGTTLVINTAKGTATVGTGNPHELRCSKCGRKATIKETSDIMGSKAGVAAQKMCGEDSQ